MSITTEGDLTERRQPANQPGGAQEAAQVFRWSRTCPGDRWRLVAEVIAPNWTNRLWERLP